MRRLAAVTILLAAAAPAWAQTGRQALAAGSERYLLADYHSALPLLASGLDPKAGPLDPRWQQGVERLADVLLVLRHDSLAATWLRWAARLAPGLAVDAEIVPPAVVRAAAAARAFVDSTPSDPFVARAEFEWPTTFRADAPGVVRLAAPSIPITARIGAEQFLRGGESRVLPPASYQVVISAPGYLPTRLTTEVLPGVTTVVLVSLLPETAGLLYVAARPWRGLSVDGQWIGYTSVAAHRVAPGHHALNLARDGQPAIDTTIVVAEREELRLSWVTKHDTTGDAGIDRALSALDEADTERGAELLRRSLGPQETALAADVRAPALARLAEASWSLGAKDSAHAYLRELVRVDPFYTPPSDLFNPDLQAAHARARRETAAIRIRAPRDTFVRPFRDTLPVQIAVGSPGEVRLMLRLGVPRPHDSLLAVLSVDSVATARIPLAAPGGGVLAPGLYAIEGQVAASGRGASDLLQLRVERLPVDTTAHRAPIPNAWFEPETRKSGVSLRTLGEGIGLGAVALLVSAAVNQRAVSGRTIPAAGVLIGGSVAIATIAFKRPSVPIPENIKYNELLRTNWDVGDRAIAAGNAATLRGAPLRIRATREP